jgi:hypothetical protein
MKVLFSAVVALLVLALASGNIFSDKDCKGLNKKGSIRRDIVLRRVAKKIKNAFESKKFLGIKKVLESVEECAEDCSLQVLKKLFSAPVDEDAEKKEEGKEEHDVDCSKFDDAKVCVKHEGCRMDLLKGVCIPADGSNSMPVEWFSAVKDALFDSKSSDSLEEALEGLQKMEKSSGGCSMESEIIRLTGKKIREAEAKSSVSSLSSGDSTKKLKKKVKKVFKKQPAKKKNRKPNCGKYDDYPKKCVKVEGCKYNLLKGGCKAEGWFRL